ARKGTYQRITAMFASVAHYFQVGSKLPGNEQFGHCPLVESWRTHVGGLLHPADAGMQLFAADEIADARAGYNGLGKTARIKYQPCLIHCAQGRQRRILVEKSVVDSIFQDWQMETGGQMQDLAPLDHRQDRTCRIVKCGHQVKQVGLPLSNDGPDRVYINAF